MVNYQYDPWGKLLSATGALGSTLGYYNPFRYRGYVYDEETGLYYLRSRYYNPTWKRFVNADIILGCYSMLLSHNMYQYGFSNPINYQDSSGCFFEKIKQYFSSNEAEVVFARSCGIIRGAIFAYKANKAAELAGEYTNALFENTHGKNVATNKDGTRANAFKHAFWNTMMTIEMGYDVAKGFADAHEKPYADDSTLHIGIPNSEHSEMDYYNNEMGRTIGLIIKEMNRDLSVDKIANIVYSYAVSDDAYYRIMDNGEIRNKAVSQPRFFNQVMISCNE